MKFKQLIRKEDNPSSILLLLVMIILSLMLLMSCADYYTETYDDTDFVPTDWTEDTHSKSADPDFSEVFDDTQVKRFDIVVTSERWQSMLANMTALYGFFGTNLVVYPVVYLVVYLVVYPMEA